MVDKDPHQHDDEDSVQGMIPDPPSNFSIEDSLSKELLKLSFQDRVAIQEEIHGVRCLSPEETPDLLQKTLREFDKLLMKRKQEMEVQFELETQQQQQLQQLNYHKETKRHYRGITTNNLKRPLLRNVQSISNHHSSVPADDASTTPSTVAMSHQNSLKTYSRTGTSASASASPRKRQFTGCYLNDPDVRLRFLRAECFDVPKAVQRMVSFLQFTQELFGDFVADRPISIYDFSSRREEVALQNSRNQFLPFRDRSGRRVFVGVGKCDFDLDPVLRYKIMIYLHWVASEDVETQQKGVVIVAWPSNEGDEADEDHEYSWEKSIRPKLNKKLRECQKKLEASMPLRVTSQQGYYKDTPFFRAMSALYYIGMNSRAKSIYKAHYGEPTELRYALSGYGIPEQLLPLSNTGTVKTSNHSRWINALRAEADREQQRREQQRQLTAMGMSHIYSNSNDDEDEVVDCPGSKDVIFRKGPTYKNNPGNMYFRELIEQTHERHTRASRKEKCKITWKILSDIEARGGRFLDWSKTREMWIVAKDRETIRKKVAACYKQYNRSVFTFQQQQQKYLNQKKRMAATQPGTIDSREEQEDPSKRKDEADHDDDATEKPPENTAAHPLPNLFSQETSTTKADQSLRQYYAILPSSTKRRKTFALFCGENQPVGYSSSSDSSTGCWLG